MKTRDIALIALCMLLPSCITPVEIGRYWSKKGDMLTLLSDSTFRYESNRMWYEESSGVWNVKNHSIVLNTNFQVDHLPLEYQIEKGKSDGAIVSIKVNAGEGDADDYLCIPVINDTIVARYPLHRGSYVMTAPSRIGTLSFVVRKAPAVLRGTGYKMGYNDVPTDTIRLHATDIKHISVTVHVIEPVFGYKVFKDEVLKIGHHSLLLKRGEKTYRLRRMRPNK
jgi:hypothetical protein